MNGKRILMTTMKRTMIGGLIFEFEETDKVGI